MPPTPVSRHVRRLQIQARRLIESTIGGTYASVFHGAGLSFADVRPYEFGDDLRAIDWKVTARLGQPFVRRHIEERELTVLLAVDASASLDFGSRGATKRSAVADLAAVVAFAAIAHGDRVGLLLATDSIERHVRARKGVRHGQRLLRDILYFEPHGRSTNLAAALDGVMRGYRRRSVLFLFSDFAGFGYEGALRRAGRKHDLVAVAVRDPLEIVLPDAGLLQLRDAETGEQRLIDAGSLEVRNAYVAARERERADLARIVRSACGELIEINTGTEYLNELVRFFQRRRRRRRR